MTFLLIVGAFLVFMGLIWSIHAVDGYASARFGYAPFALPNALFMLAPHGLLLMVIRGGGHRELLATLAGAGMLGLFLLIRQRTSGWLALYAAPILLLAAPVAVLTVLFRGFAQGDGTGES
jgi:hypothetical protein